MKLHRRRWPNGDKTRGDRCVLCLGNPPWLKHDEVGRLVEQWPDCCKLIEDKCSLLVRFGQTGSHASRRPMLWMRLEWDVDNELVSNEIGHHQSRLDALACSCSLYAPRCLPSIQREPIQQQICRNRDRATRSHAFSGASFPIQSGHAHRRGRSSQSPGTFRIG